MRKLAINKYGYTNFITIAEGTQEIAIAELTLCAAAINQLYDKVDALMECISMTIEVVRPDRNYPRWLKNIKNDIHYKSTL